MEYLVSKYFTIVIYRIKKGIANHILLLEDIFRFGDELFVH
jgi:hypothetical protein